MDHADNLQLTGIHPINASRNRGCFTETGGPVAVGVVPFVETERGNVGIVCAVFKNGQSVIPPGTGKVDASRCDAYFVCEAAVPEEESILLFQ